MLECQKCGTALEERISPKGRRYLIDPKTQRLHSLDCPYRKPPAPKPAPTGTPEALLQIIADRLALIDRREFSEAEKGQVSLIVRRVLQQENPLSVTVTLPDGKRPPLDLGRQHQQFPTLLLVLARRRNVWLVGPAGSGKTSAAYHAAKALDLPFGTISVGLQTTQSALFGYQDAHGNYVQTEFRRRYEHGGVFLFDEIDRGNPGVLTALNQAIENGTCAFPDGMVRRHSDFVAIAAANTYGNGASREYVGALQIDAATLDRFVMLSWDYDEALERDLTLATYEAAGGHDTSQAEAWLSYVRSVRKRASELGIRHVVSPRASIIGAELLAAGMPVETVRACALWKGADADTVESLSQ